MPSANVPTKSPGEVVIDKKDLRKILEETQCPLRPTKHGEFGLCSSWYFNGEMWAEVGEDSVEIIQFESEKEKRKAMNDAELMMAVDQYISCVHINKSNQIYSKLVNARAEALGQDDGNEENDAYQYLIPYNLSMFSADSYRDNTLIDSSFAMFSGRCSFLLSVFMALMNGYLLAYGLLKTMNFLEVSLLVQTMAVLMGICEVYLYGHIFISEIVGNLYSMFFKIRAGDVAYLEQKQIAMQIKNLSTLSLLRYMLSVELITHYLIYWQETLERISASFILLCKDDEDHSRKKNWYSRTFAVPLYLVQTLAPFLAVLGVWVKIKWLEFIFTGDPWTFMHWLIFLGFVNQIAGLRVLQVVEISTIQHFVFSGANASLDTEELLLLDDWWNITLLSAVSNLQLNWFDNMVFWYSLDPAMTELLLKNHVVPETKDGRRFSVLQKAKESDIILEEYDVKIFRMLKNEQKEGMALDKVHLQVSSDKCSSPPREDVFSS